MREMHEANRKHWDAATPKWRELDEEGWRQCPEQPSVAFEGKALDMIHEFIGNLHGKTVCVVGSGDNYSAFALACLGAVVTSIDISEQRLKVAEERADILGLDIDFVRCDAAELTPIPGAKFALVCSTNGFFVWIADLMRLYSEISRVLKPGGYYIFWDIHPFMRPWKNQRTIEMEKPYFQAGPIRCEEEGHITYKFHWTLGDIMNSLLEGGLVLRRILETSAQDPRFWQGESYGKDSDDSLLHWQNNARAGLPNWLTIVAQKPST